MNNKLVVVDGGNIAYINKNKEGKPQVENIEKVKIRLASLGFKPIIIIGSNLKFDIDNKEGLEKLIDKEDILQAPSDTDINYFIIKTAKEYNTFIVSNDKFESYMNRDEWIKERLIPTQIIEGIPKFENFD